MFQATTEMKLSSFVLLPFALLFNIVISQTPAESPDLKEADSLTESVVKLFKQGKFDEALPPAKRALAIHERLLPRTDPRVSTSLSYLADVYIMTRNFGEAKTLLLRLVQMQQEQFGQNDVGLAPTLDRLALAQLGAGDLEKAEDASKRALALKEKELGPDNLHVAESLLGLANVYRAHKNFELAAPVYKRALEIYGTLSGTRSNGFQQASKGFVCLAYETKKVDALKELEEIWKRLAPPGTEDGPLPLLNRKALNLPVPPYPSEARYRRLSGTVVVKVRIDQAGSVVEARDLCQGSKYLSPTAVAAARHARFAPIQVGGKPAQYEGLIVYNWVYNGSLYRP
jgi:TonB family protein